MDFEKVIWLLIGFFSVFIGAAFHNAENRKNNGAALTDFQSFLFGTGFTYFLMVAWIQLTFMLDYFIPGCALQGYNRTPLGNTWFFSIFGQGLAGEAQYPVMNLDLSILSCLVGCALGGAALVIRRGVRNKKQNTPEKGLLYGYTFPGTTFGSYIRNEIETLKSQVHPLEYLCWWTLRILMFSVFLQRQLTQGYDYVVLQLVVNLIATFIIPLMRVLFFGKLFFGNVNYRVQTLIDIFIFSGSLLGQGFGLNGEIREYDKYLHVVSGGVAVFIGCLLIESTRGGKKISKLSKTAASVGFSCTVMIVWEVFEFFTDFLMPESYNQNFLYEPPADLFFFRWFGPGAQNPGQVALLDTDLDIFLALLSCAVCGAALLAGLTVKERVRAGKMGGSLMYAYNYSE